MDMVLPLLKKISWHFVLKYDFRHMGTRLARIKFNLEGSFSMTSLRMRTIKYSMCGAKIIHGY